MEQQVLSLTPAGNVKWYSQFETLKLLFPLGRWDSVHYLSKTQTCSGTHSWCSSPLGSHSSRKTITITTDTITCMMVSLLWQQCSLLQRNLSDLKETLWDSGIWGPPATWMQRCKIWHIRHPLPTLHWLRGTLRFVSVKDSALYVLGKPSSLWCYQAITPVSCWLPYTQAGRCPWISDVHCQCHAEGTFARGQVVTVSLQGHHPNTTNIWRVLETLNQVSPLQGHFKHPWPLPGH